MKTILIPTDFSSCAENAVRFAIQLAKKEKAKLVLHHSFQIPVAIAEIPYHVIQEEKETLHKEADRKFKVLTLELKEAGLNSYSFNICEGIPADSIVSAAKKFRA